MSNEQTVFRRRSPVERLALVEQQTEAAHKRMDEFKKDIKDELRGFRNEITSVAGDIKILLGHMNRSKGWNAAWMAFGGLIGGAAGWVLEHFHLFNK